MPSKEKKRDMGFFGRDRAEGANQNWRRRSRGCTRSASSSLAAHLVARAIDLGRRRYGDVPLLSSAEAWAGRFALTSRSTEAGCVSSAAVGATSGAAGFSRNGFWGNESEATCVDGRAAGWWIGGTTDGAPLAGGLGIVGGSAATAKAAAPSIGGKA